ncbi:MAG: DrmE family protein [bacterium]
MEIAPKTLECFLTEKFGGSRFLQAVRNNHVTYSRQKIRFHAVDRILLHLFAFILRNRKEVQIIYPSPKFKIFMPLALEALWTCKQSFWKNAQIKNKERVFIITSRKDVREDYCNLKRSDGMIFHQWYPMGVVGTDGEVRLMNFLGKSRISRCPSILVSSSLEVLPLQSYADEIAAALVEIDDVEDVNAIEKFRVWVQKHQIPATVYISTNPLLSTSSYLRDKNIPTWGWNEESLRAVLSQSLINDKQDLMKYPHPFLEALPSLLNLLEGITRVIVPVQEANITKQLIELRKDYAELAKNKDPSVMTASRRLLNLIYAFEEMLAPYPYSNKHLMQSWGCLTIEDRKKSISTLIPKIQNEKPAVASFLNGVVSKVNELQETLENNWFGKPIAVTEIIDEAVRRGKSTIVVHRIDALTNALKDYLSNEKEMSEQWLAEQNISIIPQKELNGYSKADTIIYYGVPRWRNIHILRYAGALNMGFLVYRSEANAMMWLLEEEKRVEEWFSRINQIKCLSSITSSPTTELERKIPSITKKVTRKRPQTRFTSPLEAEICVGSREDFFKNFFKIDEALEIDDNITLSTKIFSPYRKQTTGPIKAFIVHLLDNRIVYLSSHNQISVYREHLNKVEFITPENLKCNDLIVLVNKSAKQGLADAVIKAVETHPKMIKNIAYQQLWISVLKEGMAKESHTTEDVSQLLSAEGYPKTPQAVYHWVNGHVIGPSEKETLRAIGKIYNNQHLIDKIEFVWNAVLRLREIHRSIGHRLKYLAPHSVVYDDEKDNQIVDEELNLHLSDFRRIITVERILKIDGPVEVENAAIDEILEAGGGNIG